jgi:hemoglobin-like flavoprotein
MRGVEETYHPCTFILIEGLKSMKDNPEANRILQAWDWARQIIDDRFVQQQENLNETGKI